jgi:hypothetical protein
VPLSVVSTVGFLGQPVRAKLETTTNRVSHFCIFIFLPKKKFYDARRQ